MGDLKSERAMCAKMVLLATAGVLAAAGILIEASSWRVAALVGIAVWAFCRAYYFFFYVIEKWIDPEFRFAGFIGAVAFLIRRGRARSR